jgi:uncharacterized protein DUF2017
MRPEVEAAREADVDLVRQSLHAEGDVRTLDDSQALAWTRALNHLRLAAGSLLGVEEDGWDEQAGDELLGSREFTMLMALGWMQERLVAAIDEGS